MWTVRFTCGQLGLHVEVRFTCGQVYMWTVNFS